MEKIDVVTTLYDEACRLRIEAERTRDIGLYLRAAGMFDLLEMRAAAERCRARAEWYAEEREHVSTAEFETVG